MAFLFVRRQESIHVVINVGQPGRSFFI